MILIRLLTFATMLLQFFGQQSLAAGRAMTRDEFDVYYELLSEEHDRELVYNEVVRLFGIGVNPLHVYYKENMLVHLADLSFNNVGNVMGSELPYTEWDKKLLKLYVQKGLNLNGVMDHSGRPETPLMRASGRGNLNLVKDMIGLGANYRVSFPGTMKFKHNVASVYADGGEMTLEGMKYFFDDLKIFPVHSREFCTVVYSVTSSNDHYNQKSKIENYLESLGADYSVCRRVVGMEDFTN